MQRKVRGKKKGAFNFLFLIMATPSLTFQEFLTIEKFSDMKAISYYDFLSNHCGLQLPQNCFVLIACYLMAIAMIVGQSIYMCQAYLS